MKTRPNEPANPAPEGPNGFKGLTKREHFAILMMQAMLTKGGWDYYHNAANSAVQAADALIDQLNKN